MVADAVPDVPIDAHVRKQGKILKHIADPTLAGRNEYFTGRIEEHFAVVDDPAAIRLQQAGDRAQGGGFSATGRPEQNQNVPFNAEPDGQGKIRQVFCDIDGQHQGTSLDEN